ncbi:MAG TPA: LysM peptidoglycan-binding domain-containing protein, partial [Oceanobacillus sp.]|nr:LysM peptidoglycan-binding domain-containing protein [Oceanobacillus sp.]
MMQRWILGLLLIAVLLIAISTSAQGTNLLQDPGFEGEYTNRGRADLNVPAPWGLWFTESPRGQYWQNLPPVAFPHPGPGPNPHGGARAFNFNKGFGTFTAAIYQQVGVPEGSNVTASAWAHLRTCNIPEGFDNCGSAVESGAYTRIGIDPNGGTNPYDSDVVWSPSAMPHDRWEQLNVSATATGSTVTLFLFTTQEWPSEINNVYWDDAFLSIGGEGGVAVNPQGSPAATIAPTAPPFVGFVVPQQPQPDGSIIHTVQPGDTIDSIAVAYGLTRAELLALNPLADPRIIQIGQQLLVREATGEAPAQGTPSVAGSPTQVAAQPTQADISQFRTGVLQPDGSIVHFVQTGDTVDTIAFLNGMTRAELMELNNMTDPRIIQLGQALILRPAPAQAPETTPEPTFAAETGAESTPEAEVTPTVEPTPTVLSPRDAPPAPIISIVSGEVLPPIDLSAQTAAVCVFIFEDVNQNRLQETGESLLADGTIRLLLDGNEVDEYTTDGVSEPYCFDELAGGLYIASAVAPDGYGLTTPAQLRVRAITGTQVTVAFGAAQGVSVAAVPPTEASNLPSETPGNLRDTRSTISTSPLNENLGLIVFGV